jgi:hypothetical protein
MSGTLSADDRLDIMSLFARYGRAVDSGNADAFVALFAKDGSMSRVVASRPENGVAESRLSTASGERALRKIALRVGATFKGKIRHHLTDLQVMPGDSPNHAHGTCYGLVTDWREGTGKLSAAGAYSATVIRTEDGWRFSELIYEPLAET